MDILVPAEQWHRIESSYSGDLAIEQKGSKPISVRTAEHGGFLYTAFSIIHGPYGEARKPCIEAWKLLPLPMYAGATTPVYRDEEAVRSGLRERGDLAGLIVAVKGELMVCA